MNSNHDISQLGTKSILIISVFISQFKYNQHYFDFYRKKIQMSILHTKFLVHWMGKDFEKNPNNLNDEKKEKYVERLKDIIENGFYMNLGYNRIWDNRNEWIKIDISRVCFSKIKISLAHKHAKRYGLLGIGVDRSFVLERYGNPVCYQYNGELNCITDNLRNVRDYLDKSAKEEDLLKNLEIVLVYCKNINEKDEEDFIYYDALEWHIVHLDRLLNE